jgi:hypothetical protein
LKLKTSPLFLQNQFYKIIGFIVLVIGLGSSPTKALAQENPGIVESLERLLDVHRKQYDQNKSKIQSNFKALLDITDLKDVKIDPQFMRSIIFHSDDKFLRLAQKDECKFLSALESNLLKTAEGDTVNILVTFKNKENAIESAAIPKNDFFDQIYKKKCLNNREFSTLFNETNFQKTIEGIKFPVPKNSNECESIHKEWLDNSYTPYLCRIQQIIKKSKNQKQIDLYKQKIPTLQKTYLDNLCNNITSPAHFCENYLKSDVWSKVVNGEVPAYKLSYKCQNLLGKIEDLTIKDLKNCAAKLTSEPSVCETKGNKNFLSDFPLQNCDIISDALNKSKLITNYHDCPGSVDNEAITNIHRLVNHFSPRKIITNKETCGGEANYTFARLNFDIKHEDGWPLKVCYMDHIKEKEECVAYIPGSRNDEPLSEDQVIAKILYQQKGAPAKTKCRIVDSKTYSPLRSEFKFGCFIVYDFETCTTLSCNKRVIWEEKPLTDIKFTGRPIFDYFPTAFSNERYSFVNMINEVKGTQGRTVKNLTDLKFYLDKISNGLVHGVGCVEDLLPEEFQRTVMNQCHPMPFIVDGYLVKHGETWLVLRAAIDDIHSPRLVLWQNIFNSVSAHSELHPLNTWTLYGIKK